MIQGYEVPHVHIHVWPTTAVADFDFRQPRGSRETEDLDRNAELLRAALEAQD